MHCALLLTRLVVKLWGYQVEFEVLKPGIFKVLIIRKYMEKFIK